MKSSNPALSDKTFAGYFPSHEQTMTPDSVMTLSGTINKSLILLFLVLAFGTIGWKITLPQSIEALNSTGGLSIPGWYIPVLIAALVVAIVTCFKASWAPVLAPFYAALEGLVLGVLSAIFEVAYPGIVVNAFMCTVATFAAFFGLYKFGIIKVTNNLRRGVIAATGAVFLVYIINFVLSFFGMNVPYLHTAGPIGIGISVLIIGVAAFNLLLDFDIIEKGAKNNVPKYMEWYSAFGLMVTIVWLYIEFLRLLSMLRRN